MSREAELYKDKIEVSLDGRQIFYLFFGGAVIVGLVFVLGVMVGRRVEARGHTDRARVAATVDPLAALDRLEGGSGLSFRGALRGDDGPASDVEKTIAAMPKHDDVKKEPKAAEPKHVEKMEEPKAPVVEKKEEPKPAEVKKPEPKADVKTEAKAEVKPEVKADVKPEIKVEARAEVKPVAKAEAKAEVKPVVKPEAKVEVKPVAKAEVKPVVKPDVQPEAKADVKPVVKPELKPVVKTEAKKEEPKSKFTLQLSSFQDKAEAQAYLDVMKSAGYSAYITEGAVEGKQYFRVRLGSYKSIEAANDAKTELEKTTKKTAVVMKL